MTRVLKSLCFASVGAATACVLTFVVVFSYSYETPTQAFVLVSVVVGSVLGFVAGALWGDAAIRWLLNALMNL